MRDQHPGRSPSPLQRCYNAAISVLMIDDFQISQVLTPRVIWNQCNRGCNATTVQDGQVRARVTNADIHFSHILILPLLLHPYSCQHFYRPMRILDLSLTLAIDYTDLPSARKYLKLCSTIHRTPT
jgi:hypothetical protein